MKLAISNIAWEKENNAQVYELMQRSSFTGLEIAPAKLFEDFLHVGSEEIVTFLNELSKYHIKPVAMQSLLFGRPDLQLFDENSRTDLKDYLIKIIDLAAKIGIKSLIFGSPKNRIYKNMTKTAAIEVAKEFFQEIGDQCVQKGVFLCIEPNPEIYGGNFLCNTAETLEFVKYVNNPGIKLHLDLGTIIINNEDINLISYAKGYITHFHISEPNLEVVQERAIHHRLKDLLNGYEGYCSIEMKGTSMENIEKSLALISNILK